MSDVGESLIKELRRRLVQHFPDQVRACLGPIPRAELRRVLDETVAQTARILDALTADRLRETTDRAGDEQTMQYLVSRTSHHWAVHTGPIVYITKLRNAGALNELWERTLNSSGR